MEQWCNGTDRGKLKCWEKDIIERATNRKVAGSILAGVIGIFH